MSHIYASKKNQAVPEMQGKAAENISKNDMLHLSGAGAPQPMSPALREKFEPGFGADFSNIRISRGHIPEEMGVQAVAKGTDILIDSRAGMDVLGHELAHVVQQAQGQVQGGFPVVHNAALEHQADVMGARAASGLSAMEGGLSGFGGGEMMSISPMSDASAPAQCKSAKEKKEEKANKKRAEESQKAAMAHMEDQKQWHSKLSPSAQQYVKSDNMYAAPTMGQDEMNAVVTNLENASKASTAKGEQVQGALREFYNDSNATVTNSAAGDMGRRIEAMFNTNGDEAAQKYNNKMITSLDELHQFKSKNKTKDGTMTEQDVNFQGLIDTFAPLAQEIRQMQESTGGTEDGIMKYAQQDYGASKGLMGKMHAVQDVAKNFTPEAKDKLFQGMGYAGGYEEYKGIANPFNMACLKGYKDQGTRMGIGNLGALYSSISFKQEEEAEAAAAAAASAQSGWKKADVSDAAYNQAPQRMMGTQRDPMTMLKKKGYY